MWSTFLIFDRTGKPKKRINRLGEGPEEYGGIHNLVYDKENQELYVNDLGKRKIFVYNLTGDYKRELQTFEKDKDFMRNIYNLDKDYLLSYVQHPTETRSEIKRSFMVISKQTGAVVKNIITYAYEMKLSTEISHRDTKRNSDSWFDIRTCEPAIKIRDSFLLNNTASDTIYKLNSDFSISPAILQTPSIKNLVPAVFLSAGKETSRYVFMNTLIKDYDHNFFEKKQKLNWHKLVYDKNTREIFDQNLYNGDYTNKQEIISGQMDNGTSNDSNQCVLLIQAEALAESYEKGEVQGKLKEVASKIDMEDNPIVMIVTFK